MKQKSKKEWNSPDHWIAVVLLGDNERAYAKVKGNFALLERIPKPKTGFHYQDIIEVEGPIGKEMFRDDEIEVFRATGIYEESKITTYSFDITLATSREYFKLQELFSSRKQKVEIPWISNPEENQWLHCLCTAKDESEIESILSEFKRMNEKNEYRRIKIEDTNEDLTR